MRETLPNRQRESQAGRCQLGDRHADIAGLIVTGMAKRRQKRSSGPLFLTEWMQEKNVTDIGLANALHVSRETVWRWQASPTRLNPVKQRQVASALKLWPPMLWVRPGSPQAKMMQAMIEIDQPSPAEPLAKTTARK